MNEIDKAIRCMKSYLPDPGWQNEYHCSNCEYYNKECKSEKFHRMAIVSLECLKKMDQEFKKMIMDFVEERLNEIGHEEIKKTSGTESVDILQRIYNKISNMKLTSWDEDNKLYDLDSETIRNRVLVIIKEEIVHAEAEKTSNK